MKYVEENTGNDNYDNLAVNQIFTKALREIKCRIPSKQFCL